MRTASDWNKILVQCHVKPLTAARWAPVFAAEIRPDTFSAGAAELDDFLGQVLHESAMLERLEENLNYSAQRLMAVWPSRFPTLSSAQALAYKPEALANFTYGNRLGNDQSGDGWKYRGRGLLQVTGKANYRAVGQSLGIDLVDKPELLAQPNIALRASIAWWERNIPDSAMGDIKRVTKLVNGGQNGLAERQALTEAAQKGLAC
jgi:putative chitinase